MRLPHPWYGSILWGVDFEGLDPEQQQKRLAQALDGLSVAVFSEAQLVVYPQLFADASHIAPGCECLLHLNAMSVWARESVYWPRQNRLREWADDDQKSRYLWRGDRIAEGWPGTRMLSVAHPLFSGAWMNTCTAPPRECDGYFLDEAHDSRGWLSPPEYWPTASLFRCAIRSQIRIATLLGGAPCWINGTAGSTPASPRRYIQNAGTMDPGYLLNVMLAACEAQPVSSRRILIQVDPRVLSADDMAFWRALAAIGDAGVEFNNPPWDKGPHPFIPLRLQVKPGTWGNGELDENNNPLLRWLCDGTVVSRRFERAIVEVDLVNRVASVEGR